MNGSAYFGELRTDKIGVRNSNSKAYGMGDKALTASRKMVSSIDERLTKIFVVGTGKRSETGELLSVEEDGGFVLLSDDDVDGVGGAKTRERSGRGEGAESGLIDTLFDGRNPGHGRVA